MAIQELIGLTRRSAQDFQGMQREYHRTRSTAPTWSPAQAIQRPSPILSRFRITSATQDGTNKRWVYSAKKVVKTAVGYGGWTDDTVDTATYTLRNTLENMNGPNGLYGNGVTSTNLTGTFDIQPIPTNAIVRAWPETFAVDGTTYTEWWFESANGVDGTCDTSGTGTGTGTGGTGTGTGTGA